VIWNEVLEPNSLVGRWDPLSEVQRPTRVHGVSTPSLDSRGHKRPSRYNVASPRYKLRRGARNTGPSLAGLDIDDRSVTEYDNHGLYGSKTTPHRTENRLVVLSNGHIAIREQRVLTTPHLDPLPVARGVSLAKSIEDIPQENIVGPRQAECIDIATSPLLVKRSPTHVGLVPAANFVDLTESMSSPEIAYRRKSPVELNEKPDDTTKI
jgi:hypothetical protein